MSEQDEKQPEKSEAGRSSYVDSKAPGSNFETREIPIVDDKDSDEKDTKENPLPDSDPGSTIGSVVVRQDKPGSMDVTRKIPKEEPDEFDSAIEEPRPRGGSSAETVAMDRDELQEDDDDTVLASRPPAEQSDLETREVPTMREEWRERAAQAAEALGETAEVVGEWGDEEGDASLAHSVAAASGELPVPENERPAAIAGSVLELAREAQREWGGRRFEERVPKFRAVQHEMVNQRADYVPSMATAIGRPMVETLTGEYIPVLEALRLIEDIFPPLLAEWHAGQAPLAAEGVAASVRMAPWGVVVIANTIVAPFAFPMALAIDALAAGNAVVICASQQHPRVNEMMRKIFHRAGFPEHLVQIVAGGPETLFAVVDAKPDKVVYYGDPDLAPRLAAHCAVSGAAFQQVNPGKDILAVLPDAPLDRAVHAAMWGAFAAGGMLPASIDRVVVAQEIYDEFRMRFVEAVRSMNSHHAQLATIGDTLNPRRFHMLVEDAVACGARVTWPAGESPGRWIHWKAAVIENLPGKAKLSTERSEGPAVALYRAEDVELELRRLMKEAPAGTLSVFGKPSRDLKTRLENAPVARLLYQDVFPMGAPGVNWPIGPELPRNLCSPSAMLRPKVMVEGDAVAGRVAWFPYTDDKAYALMDAIEATYGVQSSKRIKAALKLALNPQKRKLLRGDNS